MMDDNIENLKTECDRYKKLASNLLEASERAELFQKSLSVLVLCRSISGVIQTVTNMIQQVIFMQGIAFYKREFGCWKTSDSEIFPMEDSDLDWALSHEGPSLFPVLSDKLDQKIRSYLLFPLKSEKKVIGCLVGWSDYEATHLPQHLLRMLEALHAESAMALESVQTREELRKTATYLSQILDNFPQPFFSINREGNIKIFNEAAERFFDKQALMVLEEKLTQVFSPDFLEIIAKPVSSAFTGNKTLDLHITGGTIDILPLSEGAFFVVSEK